MKRFSFWLFIPGTVWFVIVLMLICMPQQNIPEPEGWGEWLKKMQVDKMIHAGMFGILSFLFMMPLRKSDQEMEVRRKWYFIIAFATICWGLGTECIQIALPPRTFDWLDWAADSAGVLIMWMISKKYLMSTAQKQTPIQD